MAQFLVQQRLGLFFGAFMLDPESPVIVLGTARSGTSMASGMLQILGIQMNGKNNPNSQNPKGSFEDEDFRILTTKMYQTRAYSLYNQEISDLINSRIRQNKNKMGWGWKSALSHFFLYDFTKFLKRPRLIFVFRNIYENAKSFIHHNYYVTGNWIKMDESLSRMLESQKALITCHNANSHEFPCAIVTYERMKTDPISQLLTLSNLTGIKMNPVIEQKVNDFIIPNYCSWGAK